MAPKTENLVLEHLRAMRADIAALRDDAREVKSRIGGLETTTAAIRRDLAEVYADIIGQHSRYDRLAERIERIEKRLELTPP